MDRTRHPTFSLRAFDGEEVTTVPIDKPTGEQFELEDQIARMVDAVRRSIPLHCTASDGRWSVAIAGIWPGASYHLVEANARALNAAKTAHERFIKSISDAVSAKAQPIKGYSSAGTYGLSAAPGHNGAPPIALNETI